MKDSLKKANAFIEKYLNKGGRRRLIYFAQDENFDKRQIRTQDSDGYSPAPKRRTEAYPRDFRKPEAIAKICGAHYNKFAPRGFFEVDTRRPRRLQARQTSVGNQSARSLRGNRGESRNHQVHRVSAQVQKFQPVPHPPRLGKAQRFDKKDAFGNHARRRGKKGVGGGRNFRLLYINTPPTNRR